MKQLHRRLEEFRDLHKVKTKGSLSSVLHLSRTAIEKGLPLDPTTLLTGGQVKGLGKGRIQKILKDHGIKRVLAEEGGRTSRGGVDLMRHYIEFLNTISPKDKPKLEVLEGWWIERVKEFFASGPFKLQYDSSKSLRSMIEDLLRQAEKRQTEGSGSTYAGTLLQHLVGAKLEISVGKTIKIEHHGASVADAVSSRRADFLVGDMAIHVTTSPSEALIRKCQANVEADLKPLIITLTAKIPLTRDLLETLSLSDRVDVLGADQFITTNILEKSLFNGGERKPTLVTLIESYNAIVDTHESDPSLKIAM